MSSEANENIIKDEDLENVVCLIKFILILDNSGKRIYCQYYTKEYETLESQFDFESRLSRITATLSIDRNQVDIFNFENYNIICRINNEVAIFIGQDENDNEVLLDHFLETFEMELFNFIGEDLSREKVLNHYNDIVLLVDEIVTGGVVLNIDEHSLYNRISFEKTQTNNEKQEQQSGGGIMSGLFGYFTGKKSNQTPSEQKKEEKESSNIFGGLMASAKGYLKKNIEY
jgi:hypothetical protein